MAQITTTELAEICETTPRNLRKFLRADLRERNLEIPGKGARYAIEKREVKGLQNRFKKWNAAQLEMRAAKAKEIAENAQNEIVESDDE